jgi:hypothetical protein
MARGVREDAGLPPAVLFSLQRNAVKQGEACLSRQDACLPPAAVRADGVGRRHEEAIRCPATWPRAAAAARARCGRVVCRPRMRTSTWGLGTGGVASGGVVQSVGRRVAHAAGTEVRTRRPSKDQPLPSAHTATQAPINHRRADWAGAGRYGLRVEPRPRDLSERAQLPPQRQQRKREEARELPETPAVQS